MLLGPLGASLLGNLSTGKGAIAKRQNWGIVRGGYRSKRAGYGLKKNLIPSHPLTNFETQNYYENQRRFNGVFCGDNLPKTIKNGAYVINLDKYADAGTYWIALFCRKTEIVHFDSFSVVHVHEEIKELVGNKNIKANIFRGQSSSSIMCGYFCIGFIGFMLVNKKLTEFTSLLSPYDFERNDSIIWRYFKNEWNS